MIVSEDEIMRIQDDMLELCQKMKSLKEMVFIMASGFEAINDDNCNYVISSLKVIEEQISNMGNTLSINSDKIASIIYRS